MDSYSQIIQNRSCTALRTLICSNIERRDARRTDNVPSDFFLSGPFVNVNPDPTLRQQQLHNFGVATVARCIKQVLEFGMSG